ncbi:MAG: phosphatase [Acidimicrobiaceae bacterium]|nr:phosphatase [Acidimicrobiaceae bacterium]
MPFDFQAALRAARTADPGSAPDVVAGLASDLGADDVVVYLVDFSHHTLEPLPGRASHGDIPESELVATTMAGHAFTEQRVMTAERPGGVRVWVPIVEGSDRTGVLALTVPLATDSVLRACGDLGLFAGYLIAVLARGTDLYNLYRRRRSMTLAASMQWDLLPPLTMKSSRLSVAGLLEPAYEVGGDCFDYALNDRFFEIAVVDAAGHGVTSALIAALVIGSYRHDRREGLALERTHANLDAVLSAQLEPSAFATGQLGRIDLETGALHWTNAGHPPPLLVRNGAVVGELECLPSLPWGFGSLRGDRVTPLGRASLEPGDSVLFYTDGVTEAHATGEESFGLERLEDLVGQHAADRTDPEEVVRRLVRAVREHQGGALADDATLVLVQWNGTRRPV